MGQPERVTICLQCIREITEPSSCRNTWRLLKIHPIQPGSVLRNGRSVLLILKKPLQGNFTLSTRVCQVCLFALLAQGSGRGRVVDLTKEPLIYSSMTRNRLVDNEHNMLGGAGLGRRTAVSLAKENDP